MGMKKMCDVLYNTRTLSVIPVKESINLAMSHFNVLKKNTAYLSSVLNVSLLYAAISPSQ